MKWRTVKEVALVWGVDIGILLVVTLGALCFLCWFYDVDPRLDSSRDVLKAMQWALTIGWVAGYLVAAVRQERRLTQKLGDQRQRLLEQWDAVRLPDLVGQCPKCKTPLQGKPCEPAGKLPRGLRPPTLRAVLYPKEGDGPPSKGDA